MQWSLVSMFIAGVMVLDASTVSAAIEISVDMHSEPTDVLAGSQKISLGERPISLVEKMGNTALREQLQKCEKGPFRRSDFSIAHRGAPLEFPEHTRESYIAAATQGAGKIECDVTFTRDRELVCRHAQCDLHTTTDMLAIPDLATKCAEPFEPASYDVITGEKRSAASARCCTSDITLDEFKRLSGKRDNHFPDARSVREYMYGPGVIPSSTSGTLMTHRESIELFKQLDVQMVPELKEPEIAMVDDFTQQDYAGKMLEEYKTAGVPSSRVWPQSFSLADIQFWIDQYPDFAPQLVYLDGRDEDSAFNHADPNTWQPSMQELAEMGVRIIAPPIWMLLTAQDKAIVPSVYAEKARSAGLDIITWSLERSGSLASGGGWYYQSVSPLINNDGQTMEVLDVLAHEVGVIGVFSDWPATVTYFANCMGLP
jgi:glycerophosphoryl diester phosphodiesterase